MICSNDYHHQTKTENDQLELHIVTVLFTGHAIRLFFIAVCFAENEPSRKDSQQVTGSMHETDIVKNLWIQ